MTNTLAVHTVTTVQAVTGAGQLTAVFPCKASETHTLAIHTLPAPHAIFRTGLDATVLPSITFFAHTLPVDTVAPVVTIAGAGQFTAIFTLIS